MQKRVVLLSAAVTVLGLAAAVLGFVAESTKSKAFVGFDGQRCVYRRTPALACSVAAALLALAGLALVTADSWCLRRDVPVTAGRKLSTFACWVVVGVAVLLFLYGAAMNRGGTRDLSTSRWGRRYSRTYYYGCTVLKNGVFATASVLSAVATGCAVAAYIYFQRTDEMPPAPGVALGQLQWAQPYPPPPYPPPMAYPAPPQYGQGGYGPKQPAGTA